MTEKDTLALSLSDAMKRTEALRDEYEDAARLLVRSVGLDYSVEAFNDLRFTAACDSLRDIHKRWTEARDAETRLRMLLRT
jgi:hypothetical protein